MLCGNLTGARHCPTGRLAIIRKSNKTINLNMHKTCALCNIKLYIHIEYRKLHKRSFFVHCFFLFLFY